MFLSLVGMSATFDRTLCPHYCAAMRRILFLVALLGAAFSDRAVARDADIVSVATRLLPARALKDAVPAGNERDWRIQPTAVRVRVGFPPATTRHGKIIVA